MRGSSLVASIVTCLAISAAGVAKLQKAGAPLKATY